MPETAVRKRFSSCPVLWLACAFAAGILAAGFVDIPLWSELVASSAVSIIAAVVPGKRVAAYLILAAFAAAGAASATCEKTSISSDRIRMLYDAGTISSGDPVEIEGVLTSGIDPAADGDFINLRASAMRYRGTDLKASGIVRLFLPAPSSTDEQTSNSDDTLGLKYGSRVKIASVLFREDQYLNPGVVPRRDMLDRSGIDATGTVKSPLLIEKVADESVFLPLAWIYGQRTSVIGEFKQHLSPSAAGIMIASLLGDKYFLDKNTADLFRQGGTFHILVISGLHVTFIGGLLLLFVRQFTRRRSLHFLVTSGVLWAYTLAVGADVPVVRASLMFTIVLFSYLVYRRSSLLNSLGVCVLVLLVWRPSDLFNPSLQLTFVSVGAIIGIAYPVVETLQKIGRWVPSPAAPFPPTVPLWLKRLCESLYWSPDAWMVESKRQIWRAILLKSPFQFSPALQRTVRYLFEAVLLSLVVQISMLPLAVVYFHRVSIASVVLNIWVGSFIALESLAMVTGVVVNHVSSLLASGFFALGEAFNWIMLTLPRLFSDNGWASFRLPSYSGAGRWVYALYFIPVIAIAAAVSKWRPFASTTLKPRITTNAVLAPASALLILLMVVVIFHPFSAPASDGRLYIDFLDVGQGDSALVTFPDGKTLLVDGGGQARHMGGEDDDRAPFETDVRGVGESVVSEFLWWRGYSRLDYIAATHADADHIQGLTDVAKNFSIGTAIFARTPVKNPNYAELASVLNKRGVPVEKLASGDSMKIGDVRLDILYPGADDDPDAVSDNNHSLVLRLSFGDRSVLLTGDIERDAESMITADGSRITADVIKVPHHGSRTSSTQPLIDAVAAKYAVISVGRRSPFGHPHADVVSRWLASGASVMTTGEGGMISVSTDGKELSINRFLSDQGRSPEGVPR